MVCPYHFNCFKDCVPQIFLGPFLNTLTSLLIALYIALNMVFDLLKLNALSGEVTHWTHDQNKIKRK